GRAEPAGRLGQEPQDGVPGLARHVRAHAAIADERISAADVEADVESAVAGGHAPRIQPDWSASLLVDLAQRRTADPRAQRRLLERARDAATTREGRAMADEGLRLPDVVGRPLDLDFTNALTGARAAAGGDGEPRLLALWSATAATAEADLRQLDGLREELAELDASIVLLDPWCASDRLDEVRAAAARLHLAGTLPVAAGDFERTWAFRHGFRSSPWFAWVGADGRVAALVARAAALQGRLRELSRAAR